MEWMDSHLFFMLKLRDNRYKVPLNFKSVKWHCDKETSYTDLFCRSPFTFKCCHVWGQRWLWLCFETPSAVGQELSHVSEVFSFGKRPGQHGTCHLLFNCKCSPCCQKIAKYLSTFLNMNCFWIQGITKFTSQFFSCRFSSQKDLSLKSRAMV